MESAASPSASDSTMAKLVLVVVAVAAMAKVASMTTCAFRFILTVAPAVNRIYNCKCLVAIAQHLLGSDVETR